MAAASPIWSTLPAGDRDRHGQAAGLPAQRQGGSRAKGRIGVPRGQIQARNGNVPAPKISPDQPDRLACPLSFPHLRRPDDGRIGHVGVGADSVLGDPKGAVIDGGGLAVPPEGTVDLAASHPSPTDPERDFPQEGAGESCRNRRPRPAPAKPKPAAAPRLDVFYGSEAGASLVEYARARSDPNLFPRSMNMERRTATPRFEQSDAGGMPRLDWGSLAAVTTWIIRISRTGLPRSVK